MYDIFTFGQATQDVYLMSKKFKVIQNTRSSSAQAACFAFGSKMELDDVLFEVGGGGTNTAVTFSRLGLSTAVVTKIGSDAAGEEIIASLHEHGVSSHFVSVDDRMRSGYSTIFLNIAGERAILVYRGASHSLKPTDIDWKHIDGRWIYISSLAGNLTLVRKIFAHAKKKGIRVAWNPGALELQAGIKKIGQLVRHVDVLLLNREEAVTLLGARHEKDIDLVRRLDKACEGIAVITEGEKGSWVCDNTVVRRIHIRPVKAVDTTGAGDAYGSGFVAGLIKRPGDIDYALRLASINSASVVQEIGAKHGLISRKLPRTSWMRIRTQLFPSA